VTPSIGVVGGLTGMAALALSIERDSRHVNWGRARIDGVTLTAGATNTIVQTITKEHFRGRVMAFYTMAFLGTAPLGSLLAGVLADRIGEPMTIVAKPTTCELCVPVEVVSENKLAYVRYDNNSLSRGHVLVVPKRHVASFFDCVRSRKQPVENALTGHRAAAVAHLVNLSYKQKKMVYWDFSKEMVKT
jgi:hypothetical protein